MKNKEVYLIYYGHKHTCISLKTCTLPKASLKVQKLQWNIDFCCDLDNEADPKGNLGFW